MTLQEAEMALHELFVHKPANAAAASVGILRGVLGELDELSPSTQRELQVLVLEEKLEAGIIDEDVAGLVESLFNADDPEHEQLHLAVRTQAFLRKKGCLHGQEDQCLIRQATEVLFEPPQHCQNGSLCDSLAALRAAAEHCCVQHHKQIAEMATQDANPCLSLQATWDKYPLFYAQQLLRAALEAERIWLTDLGSKRNNTSTAPSADPGRGAARKLAFGMTGEAGAAAVGAEDQLGAHGNVTPSAAQGAAPAQPGPALPSASQQDDLMCAQQRLSLSIPSDSDIDVGGTPPPLPPPAIRPDWADPGSRAGTAAAQQARLSSQQGCVGLRTSQEQIALVPDTYEDMDVAQRMPELASSEAAEAQDTDSPLEMDDVENSSLHSNGGLRLSGSPSKTSSQRAKHAQQGTQAQGQAGRPDAQHAKHGSDSREPAGQEGTPCEDTPYSSPVETLQSQEEHPAAGQEPSAPTLNDRNFQGTPYSSLAEVPLDQAAPDRAPRGPAPAGGAAGGDLSEDELFEDAAQTLLEFRTRGAPMRGSAQAAASAGNDEGLHAQQQPLDDAAAQGEGAAASPGAMQHDMNVFRNVTDAQPHASFGSGPLSPSPVEDILDLTGTDQEANARVGQPDLARMTITQKPAAVAQPRRRQDRRPATSAQALPAPGPTSHPGTDHEGGSPDRAQMPVSAALPVPEGAAENALYAPKAVLQRRTARKRMGAAVGNGTAAAPPTLAAKTAAAPPALAANTAAAPPTLAARPSPAVPTHQQTQTSSAIQARSRPHVLEQPRGAPPAQRSGPSASGQLLQQPAAFDLSAALQDRQSAQAPSALAPPDQARQAWRSIPAPAVAARAVPEAQMQSVAQQASAGEALVRAASRWELPGQAPDLLGKRAAEPCSEPPVKRTRRADGSLLGLANMVIRDFARRRLRGAAGNPLVAATPPAVAGALRGAPTPLFAAASPAASTPAAASAGAAASAAPAAPVTVPTASLRAVVEAASRHPGSVAVPTLVPERFRRANARANAAIRQMRAQSPLPSSSLGVPADGSGLFLGRAAQPSPAQPSLGSLTSRAHVQQGHHPSASRQPDQAPLPGAPHMRNSPVLEQPFSRLWYEAGPPPVSSAADGVQSGGRCADLPAEIGLQDVQPGTRSSWPQWTAGVHSNSSRAPRPGTAGHAGQPSIAHGPPSHFASGQGYMQLPLVSTRGLSEGSPIEPAPEQRPNKACKTLSQGLAGQVQYQATGAPAYLGHRSSAWQRMEPAQQPIAAVAAADPVLQHIQHATSSNAVSAAGPSVVGQTSISQARSVYDQQTMSSAKCPALPAVQPHHQTHDWAVNSAAQTGIAAASAVERVLMQPRMLSDPTMLYHHPLRTMRDTPRPGISPTELWSGFERPFTGHGRH